MSRPETRNESPGLTRELGLTDATAIVVGFLIGSGILLVGPLFSPTAWNNVTFTGEETRNTERVLPRDLILGTSSVVLLYLLANFGYVLTLPFDQIQNAPQDRVGTALIVAPHTSGIGFGIVRTGLPVHFDWTWIERRPVTRPGSAPP